METTTKADERVKVISLEYRGDIYLTEDLEDALDTLRMYLEDGLVNDRHLDRVFQIKVTGMLRSELDALDEFEGFNTNT